MTTSLRMEDWSHMTERILELILEIIQLVTGENYKIVKGTSGELLTPSSHRHGPSPITERPPHSLISERNNVKKIVEVFNKMMKLLTGEEWQYLGHKELYKDTMIEIQPLLTSLDESSYRIPPEGNTGPLYSQDCPLNDHIIHQQKKVDGIAEKLIYMKPEVKEEKEEDIEEETEVTGGRQCMEEGDMMVTSEVGMPISDASSKRNLPEGCTGPLYSWDFAQEDHTIPHNYQNGKQNNLSIASKEEVKEEEGADSVMEEAELSGRHKDLCSDFKIESSTHTILPERSTGPLYPQDCPQEDHSYMLQYQPEELTDIKHEVKEEEEEETEVTGGRQCMEEGDMMVTSEFGMPVSDASSKRNLPEECTGPLYSWDFSQEDHTIPHNYQNGKQNNVSIAGKEKVKEEEGADSVMEEAELLGGHKELCGDFKTEASIHTIPPERSTGPLYPQDCPQEDHSYVLQYQAEELTDLKHEIKEEEETEVTGGRQCMEEGDMMVTSELGMPVSESYCTDLQYSAVDARDSKRPPARFTEDDKLLLAQIMISCRYDIMRTHFEKRRILMRAQRSILERYHRYHPLDAIKKRWSDLKRRDPDFICIIRRDLAEDASSKRNLPEGCTGPLYSWDISKKDHTIPQNYQAEELTYIKVVVKEEETDVTGVRQCMEEGDMMVTSELGMPVSGSYCTDLLHSAVDARDSKRPPARFTEDDKLLLAQIMISCRYDFVRTRFEKRRILMRAQRSILERYYRYHPLDAIKKRWCDLKRRDPDFICIIRRDLAEASRQEGTEGCSGPTTATTRVRKKCH
ncbi:uncharacterized protein [Hyperolius riggenbachi]|uniref:uncharacterized protein n=1 Tax=Hyperolius riggenbachi TaxID=752182 RepID=UPI0035A299B0